MASLFRAALSAAEWPYSLAVRHRNRRYDAGRATAHKVNVPVVSVGNITLGGTGKTPLVHYLAEWFRRRDVSVCIVSRGYRAVEGRPNDEARELSEKLPGVPHLQNPDRVAAAQAAIAQHQAQLILLDDGFQHRRLARDLDIVLIDALEPFGFEHVFPRGTLREPLVGLARADVIGLSRADLVDDAERSRIRRRVAEINADAVWLELSHRPRRLWGSRGCEELSVLPDAKVLAFCGIGNPAGFRASLGRCGPVIQDFREFPDHHAYTQRDVSLLAAWVEQHQPQLVICTHKDLVKLDRERFGDAPLWALAVELEVLQGEPDLESRLVPLLFQAKS